MQSVHCSVFTSAQRRDDIDGEQSIVVHSTVERRDDIGELMCFSSQCSLFTVQCSQYSTQRILVGSCVSVQL